ncbi:ATP-binding protein [Kitasatospora terrestris]|uniref:ATP-binding protein n=1 Tax=Kitasatospora terrestris TaxID=258051 RepID=A0ABP9EFH5_9ACTN
MPPAPAFHRQLSFPAGPLPVSEGIGFTRRTLTAWFPRANPAACAEIVLIAAELLANAVQHAGGPLTLGLRMTQSGRIRITVTDAGAEAPQVGPALPERPGGHGMRIVDHLARAWGTDPVAGGKGVWAECDPPTTSVP